MPGFAYACATVTPVPPVESPKSQVYETIVPLESNEVDALNVTREPRVVGDGPTVNRATGPGGGVCTTTSSWAVPLNASLSVTFSVTLYVPIAAYECRAILPLPNDWSPKFHAYETMVPSGSVDADASNVTFSRTNAGFGVAVNEAIGCAWTTTSR